MSVGAGCARRKRLLAAEPAQVCENKSLIVLFCSIMLILHET
jgi:hypothetical protein